ncbi:hypothetical protein H4R34_001709 [Dimargaris verticillata]|uniref:Nucleoporin Pom152 n=1 Tax=Dimargaris verticillata TaxID=2761393 RepID=A0A9W8B9D1_9FUNG|nr:hypothetical protein H4R34_001709 [Dimargaris verticillata]
MASPTRPGQSPVPKIKPRELMPRPRGSASQAASSIHLPRPAAARPVIPTHIIDGPQQRLYAISLFALLQALKLANAWDLTQAATTATGAGLFAKWLLIDGVWVGLVWLLRIPWFQYPTLWYVLAVFGLLIVNSQMFLASKNALFLTAEYVGLQLLGTIQHAAWQILPVWHTARRVVVPDREALRRAHILGKHTVHILPFGSARINPANTPYCLDTATRRKIQLPILLNGTVPDALKYSYQPLVEAARVQTHTVYLKHYPQQLTTLVTTPHWTTYSFALEVTQPGVYAVERVVDHSGTDFRVQTRKTIVVECPQAYLQYTPVTNALQPMAAASAATRDSAVGEYSSQHMCLGETIPNLTVRLQGSPLFALEYLRRVNGKETIVTVEGVGSQGAAAVVHGAKPSAIKDDKTKASPVSTAADLDPGRFRTQQIDYAILDRLDVPGEYFIKLTEVRDQFNNSQSYTLASSTEQFGSHPDEVKGVQIWVHRPPTVRIQARKNVVLKRTLDGTTTDSLRIPIVLTGKGPWHVEYNVVEDPNRSLPIDPKPMTLLTDKPQSELVLTQAGSLVIYSVRDTHCRGIVVPESPQVTVVNVPPPTLSISSSPIKSACVGEIGSLLTLNLQGQPPFTVHYRRSFKNEVKQYKETSNSHRVVFRFTPNLAGHYECQFYRVSDANYPKGMDIEPIGFSQMVHPPADATWAPLAEQPSGSKGGSRGAPSARGSRQPVHSYQTCLDEFLNIPVELQGTGPWTLNYQVTHQLEAGSGTVQPPGNAIVHTVTDLIDPWYTLSLGPFTQPGTVAVDLLNITDVNGCTKNLALPEVSVHVRAQKPTAQFLCHQQTGRHRDADLDTASSSTVWFLSHEKFQLPVQLTGEGPWQVSYRDQSLPEDHPKAVKRIDYIIEAQFDLTVSHPGVYELVSMADADCPGQVPAAHAQCTVAVIPPPALQLAPTVSVVLAEATKPPQLAMAELLRLAATDASHLVFQKPGLYWRPPVCRDVADRVQLQFQGHAPWRVYYQRKAWKLYALYRAPKANHFTRDSRSAKPMTNSQQEYYDSYKSIYEMYRSFPTHSDELQLPVVRPIWTFDLDTHETGFVQYQFQKLSDADYHQAVGRPLATVDGKGSKTLSDLNIVQLVMPQPFAQFVYSQHDLLLSTSHMAHPNHDLKLLGPGVPPTAGPVKLPLTKDELVTQVSVATQCMGEMLGSMARAEARKTSRQPGKPGPLAQMPDLTVKLYGTPPFTLEYQVYDPNYELMAPTGSRITLATSLDPAVTVVRHGSAFQVQGIRDHLYALRPPVTATLAGKYWVVVTRIQDSFGCQASVPMAADEPDVLSSRNSAQADLLRNPDYKHLVASVQVYEAANVAPHPSLGAQPVCAGGQIPLTLQGIPPWSVTYEVNDRQFTQRDVKDTVLRIPVPEPGTVRITRVCHTTDYECCTTPSNLAFTVHPIPRLRVNGGREISEDIHEGEQTAIEVQFTGTAPFSFSYVRTAIDNPSNILETQTITGIHDTTYTITTSQEGTFEAVSISDRYCRFP